MSGTTLTPPRPVTPVAILADLLARIEPMLDGVEGVPPEVVAHLRTARALAAGLDPYLGACTTPESPALARLAARTRSQDWTSGGHPELSLEQEMLSGHVEGQLLAMLVHLTGARQVLDIGMFTGYSALAMAEALPADGRVVACELDPDVARVAQECFDDSPDGGRVDVRVGPASTTLDRLEAAGESFDLVFLDADKAGYLAYLERLLDGCLVAPGGVVCADNTLLQGQPYGAGEPTANGLAIAQFNQAVADDGRLTQVMLPLRDGITLIRRAGDQRKVHR